MSQTEVLLKFPVDELEQNLPQEGVIVRAGNRVDLPEEAPEAY